MSDPFLQLIGKAHRVNHPVYASLELTYQCNLACRFCYNPVQRKGQARSAPPPEPGAELLSYGEILGLLDQLRDLGVLFLTLTGGEPMLHPRFWDVAREAKRRSFALRIFSNGIAIDERAADLFADLVPYCVEISLHGSTDSTAEALNQVKGSQRRTLRAISLLKDRGVRVFLKCVLTRLVEDELEGVKALADEFGLPIYFDPFLYPSIDGQAYPLELKASDGAIYRLFSETGINIGNSPFEVQPDFNCSVASGTLHIDPYGFVHPCVQWEERIGSVRENSMRELWEGSPRLEAIRSMSRALPAHIRRSTGDYAFCSFCPAHSRRESGDPMRLDEQHLRVAHIRRVVYRDRESRAPLTAASGPPTMDKGERW